MAPRAASVTPPVCVIVGVGPGNGAACARRFASEGYAVALCARSRAYLEELAQEVPGASAHPWDATDVAAAPRVFERIRAELGPPSVVVYNAGSGAFGSPDDTTLEDFQRAWEVNARGLLVTVREVLPDLRAAGAGSLLVIGATASLRGGAGFTAFASAKAAQRSLAQSLARHLWPEGIHVAYVVIDGVIDMPRTRRMLPDRPDAFFLRPSDIAESVFFLAHQPRQAWSFELDLRPFGERW